MSLQNRIAAFVCVQALNLPTITLTGSLESSEEEYSILLPAAGQLSLPGVGVVNQPVVQAVEVKVPRFVSPEIKQQIIAQTLLARGINLQSLVAKTTPVAADKAVQTADGSLGATAGSDATTVDSLTVSVNPIETGKESTVPITPVAPILPAVPLAKEVVSQVPTLPPTPVVPDVVSTTEAPIAVPV